MHALDALTLPPPSPIRLASTEPRSRVECAQVRGGTRAAHAQVALPGLEGFLYARPCRSEVGGDIHYLSACGAGLLARFCLADVVGHGDDAAAVSADTHELLARFIDRRDHRLVLDRLNRALTAKGLGSLTTAAMFTYSAPTRVLTYSYAGHPPAWRWSSADRTWAPLAIARDRRRRGLHDLPLAIAADTAFSRGRVRTAPGDVIVVVTDGVGDALGADRRRFGEAGLLGALQDLEDPSPRRVVDAIVDRLRAFCGPGCTHRAGFDHDDVTVLALRTVAVTPLEMVRSVLVNRLGHPWRPAHAARRGGLATAHP